MGGLLQPTRRRQGQCGGADDGEEVMVKLPPFDFEAAKIRAALDEGRRHDAAKMIVEKMRREGHHSEEFIKTVAGFFGALLHRKRTGERGRPKGKKPPRFWSEIGDEYRRLRDEGKGYNEAVDTVAKDPRFPHTASVIKNTVLPYYEKTLEEIYWETRKEWEAIKRPNER